MKEEQKEFLFKEYDKLNAEIAKLLEETRTREKYSLTIISVVAAWIYTAIIKSSNDGPITAHDLMSIIHWLSWLPLMITLAYGISVLLIYKNIKWIGSYLSIIEKTFVNDLEYAPGKTLGWEKHFDEKNRKSFFVTWTWAFWILQLIIGGALVYKLSSI